MSQPLTVFTERRDSSGKSELVIFLRKKLLLITMLYKSEKFVELSNIRKLFSLHSCDPIVENFSIGKSVS